jgi:hypothetical protein
LSTKNLHYLGFRSQLTVFLIKLYVFPSSGCEFIFFILLARLLAPPNVPLFSNVCIEVFDTVLQLLISVL